MKTNGQRLWIAALALAAGCANKPTSPAPQPVAAPLSVTTTEGQTVTTTTRIGERYATTVTENGQLVFKMEMRPRPNHDLYTLQAELLQPDGSTKDSFLLPVGVAKTPAPPDEHMNRAALFQLSQMRRAYAIQHKLPVPQDDAGCNGFGGSCSDHGACCDWHDKCLADNWDGAGGGVGWIVHNVCNPVVFACIAGTLTADFKIGAAIGSFIPGIGNLIGGLIGVVLGWFGIGAGPGPSACCDQNGINLCLSPLTDATPGSWYLWGNHACNNAGGCYQCPRVIHQPMDPDKAEMDYVWQYNHYCFANQYQDDGYGNVTICSDIQCFNKDGSSTTDFVCDPCSTYGSCNDGSLVRTNVPLRFPARDDALNLYLNPPLARCPGNAPPGPHATRITCNASYDSGSCQNVCIFESGLGGGAIPYCGPHYNLDACILAQPGYALPRGCDGAGHCVIETWCDFTDSRNWSSSDPRWVFCAIGPPDYIAPYCDEPVGAPPPAPPPPLPYCGDGSCAGGENCTNCARDCACGSGTTCQNGQCVPVPPPPPPSCGDGICQSGEDCSGCPGDCPCPSGTTCQSGQCVTPPSLPNCGAAGGNYCAGPGDNSCSGYQTFASSDCTTCCYKPPLPSCGAAGGNYCAGPGDNSCSGYQTFASSDCATCCYKPPLPSCGAAGGNYCAGPSDNSCSGYQTFASYDCATCCYKPPAPYCGDGSCQPGVEDCGNCPGDCPCPSGTNCQSSQCVAPPACSWYDCAGTCNGGATVDACGVCGGNGSECAPPACSWYDCAGTCNGGATVDACGVCGGDGSECAPPACSWYDCAGTCNGGASYDSCGVCGGDGSECY